MGKIKVTPENLRDFQSDLEERIHKISQYTDELSCETDLFKEYFINSKSESIQSDADNEEKNIYSAITILSRHIGKLSDIANTYEETERRNVDGANSIN